MNDEVARLKVGEMDSRCLGAVMVARDNRVVKSRLSSLPMVVGILKEPGDICTAGG
jgi:hypothetical protein